MRICIASPIKKAGNTGRPGINTERSNVNNTSWAPKLVFGTKCLRFLTQKLYITICLVSQSVTHLHFFTEWPATGIGLGDMWDAVRTASGQVVYRNSLVVGSGSYATSNGRMGYEREKHTEKM
jgi:hypothetical protein